MMIRNVSSFVAPAYLYNCTGVQYVRPHSSIIARSVCCRGWVPAFAGTKKLGVSQ